MVQPAGMRMPSFAVKVRSFRRMMFTSPEMVTFSEMVMFSSTVIPRSVNDISGNPFAGSSVQVIYGFPGTAAKALADNFCCSFREIDDAWLATHGR